ncbi:MAG: alpha/beta fold hydrolase [Solirubrobacterales bacterium]|nr:alpha/beta fold hydrolase [Solirubrobacterales bacterium]
MPPAPPLWRTVLPAVAAAGWHAVAPDLPGHGDSPLEPHDGTWHGHIRALDDLVTHRGWVPEALVLHDWGGLIGLRWALDAGLRPRALVLSGTGFFADGRWHGLAEALRGPMGERTLLRINDGTFASMLRAAAPGVGDDVIADAWKGMADPERRRAVLRLYRSGDFTELEPYEPRLPELAAPTLLLWGARDSYAPLSGAHRFAALLPDTRLVVLEEAGHFAFEDEPRRAADEVAGFLAAHAG